MNAKEKLIIVGTGLTAVEVAFNLRASGWDGDITLVGDAAVTPHHLPPLSKAYLSGSVPPESLHIRTLDAYETHGIHLLTDKKVLKIDRNDRKLVLASGEELQYNRLVLATGGRPRSLPAASAVSAATRNFSYLRTLQDAETIKQNLVTGKTLVVIGGGYIGLEVAAAAAKAGMQVTVLASSDRILDRVTAPPISEFFEHVHRTHGVDIQTNAHVNSLKLTADNTMVEEVICADGRRFHSDLVVTGIGLVPNVELASEAHLQVADGIVINSDMQTSDPLIMAAGDCAQFYSTIYKREVRIESVPNALEHARKIAALLCGQPPRKEAAPWFWSDQYDVGLKMVGLSQGYDRIVVRGSTDKRDFTLFYLLKERVLAVDTVNRPVEFTLSKQIITDGLPVDTQLLSDESVTLKELVSAARATASAV